MKKDGVKSSDLQTLMTEVKPYLDDACYRLAWDFVKNRQLTFKEAMEFIGFVSFLTRSLRQYSQEDVEHLEEDNDDLKDQIDDLEIQTCNLEGEKEAKELTKNIYGQEPNLVQVAAIEEAFICDEHYFVKDI